MRLPLADFAVIGTSMNVVILAAAFRRAGFSVDTQWSGKRRAQLKRADDRSFNVFDADKAEDLFEAGALLARLTATRF